MSNRAARVGAFAALLLFSVVLARLTADVRSERNRQQRTAYAAAINDLNALGEAPVVISEFLARNAGGLRDEDGDSPDWIELHNRSDAPVNLTGWSLTDQADWPDRWTFPEVVIEPGAYLVVFASGKDRRLPDARLHTNFRLDDDGGYLGLFAPNGVSESSTVFFPRYPAQAPNISCGPDGERLAYFEPPTPGAENTDTRRYEGVLTDLQFSTSRGVYAHAFSLRIASQVPGTTIRYTLDGRDPTMETGLPYEGGIRIARTTTVRARAFREHWVPSPLVAHTFVLPFRVAAQQAPDDYPSTWGEALTADYTVDPSFSSDVDAQQELAAALTTLPTIALAVDPSHLFDPESGIYTNTESDGADWERPASFEFIDYESSVQIHAGLRIHGRSSRKPMTSPKHSFRLLFKAQYGDGTLRAPLFGADAAEGFDTLVLHATSNYSWTFPLVEQRVRAQYTRDAWAKETQRAMGHASAHVRYAQLYINGLYWGIYAVSERPDANFMASYFGGRWEDYDVRKGGETVDGEDRAWRTLLAMSADGFESEESYAALLDVLDIDNFIDYMILNHYAGNENWDYGNWYAARRRAPGGQWRFFVWDMESILGRVGENSVFVRHRDRPTELFHRLRDNPAFRERFASRVRLHLTGDGVLTPAQAAARYERHAEILESAILAESARWGDYRATVHPYRTGPYDRYTPKNHWETERRRLMTEYFPKRTEILLDQYRNAGLYPQ